MHVQVSADAVTGAVAIGEPVLSDFKKQKKMTLRCMKSSYKSAEGTTLAIIFAMSNHHPTSFHFFSHTPPPCVNAYLPQRCSSHCVEENTRCAARKYGIGHRRVALIYSTECRSRTNVLVTRQVACLRITSHSDLKIKKRGSHVLALVANHAFTCSFLTCKTRV